MLVNGEECLTYATQHGTGWRADCLGDLGFLRKWAHMEQGYPTWIREAGIQETWQTAPVAWETGGQMPALGGGWLVAPPHSQLRPGIARVLHQQQIGSLAIWGRTCSP